MKKNERIEKFKKMVEPIDSGWMKKAALRKEKEIWKNYSALIALRIMAALEKSGKTQKELASELGKSPQYVSKLLKGEENLTLETICRLEAALSICLIRIETAETTQESNHDKPTFFRCTAAQKDIRQEQD